ncbi:hypothetical protein ACH4E9_18570 [Streptomyces anulatus]|uniref:hypothetical protein n=1 Tax=Streptomyces anulatus TaxID=1892 RepID=UPI002258F1EE|nr:hypothetical protein [Streptomyces anulatus]MCX4506465.1 hypothetical protein [Streptomyces anulatus]
MPKPIRMGRRTWVAAWAVLCVAGLAATAGLKSASAPEPPPERPVSAECREFIARVKTQLDKAEQKGGDGILAFSRGQVGTVDCTDELRNLFRGER